MFYSSGVKHTGCGSYLAHRARPSGPQPQGWRLSHSCSQAPWLELGHCSPSTTMGRGLIAACSCSNSQVPWMLGLFLLGLRPEVGESMGLIQPTGPALHYCLVRGLVPHPLSGPQHPWFIACFKGKQYSMKSPRLDSVVA